MKNIRFILFVLFAAASVVAPLSVVWKYENILRSGTLYKFRTKPVDPYDAFRGRYVTLAFEDDYVSRSEQEAAANNAYSTEGLMYVRLANDTDGFAKPIEASRTPLAGDDVITVDYAYPSQAGWKLRYPFNRYYLPEDLAPEAEKLYEKTGTGGASAETDAKKSPAYVAVRVHNGAGVIEELFIDGKPVREAVRSELDKQKTK